MYAFCRLSHYSLLDQLAMLQCVSDVGAELGYILPFDDLPNFPRLFKQLDEQLADLKVSSYGVAITTLEDVFLKVSQLAAFVRAK